MVGTTLDLLVVAIKRGKQETPHTGVGVCDLGSLSGLSSLLGADTLPSQAGCRALEAPLLIALFDCRCSIALLGRSGQVGWPELVADIYGS